MLKTILFGGAFFGALAIIAYLSLSSLPFVALDLGFNAGDKLGHALAYAVTMMLGCLLWRERRINKSMFRRHYLILGLGLFGYGIVIEVLQYVLPVNRWAELWDVFANGVGVLSGGFVYHILFNGLSVKKA